MIRRIHMSTLIGEPVQENKEKASRANPIAYITGDAPPKVLAIPQAERRQPVDLIAPAKSPVIRLSLRSIHALAILACVHRPGALSAYAKDGTVVSVSPSSPVLKLFRLHRQYGCVL